MYFLLALASGGLTALSRTVNAALGTRIGPLRGSLVNHVVGALAAGLLVAIGLAAGGLYAFGPAEGLPWIYLTGGCLGVLVVAAGNYAAARIGVTLLAMVMLAFQLASSAFIDHYGLLGTPPRPLTMQRAAGIALLLAGAYVAFSAPDQNTEAGLEEAGIGSHETEPAEGAKKEARGQR